MKLYLFDADGTLWNRDAGTIRPNVAERCANLMATPDTKFAICSNQGGVGLRLDMIANHWGDPKSLPTPGGTVRKYEALARCLFGSTTACPVYLAFRFVKNENVYYAPAHASDPRRWLPEWRKPAPGMLIQAMADAGAAPSETIFVGDNYIDDAGAAIAAGCTFIIAAKFFERIP